MQSSFKAIMNESVLVVDDNEPVRTVVAEMLRHLDFRVQTVGSGPAALVELGKNTYTFVLTDIKMPEMDGLQLIRRVRKDYPDVCSIAMTGYSEEYKYMDVLAAGTTDFINKPINAGELEAKFKRAIAERDLRIELERLSITDSLTGLYNYRHFHNRIREEMIRSERQKTRLGMILIDLDGFKGYNDTYGHLAGDELLRKVANVINSMIREGVDSGYRYGGDEFAILLIDADNDTVQTIGDRVEKGIIKECGLTASIGHAGFSPGMSVDAIVGTADEELYKNKKKRH